MSDASIPGPTELPPLSSPLEDYLEALVSYSPGLLAALSREHGLSGGARNPVVLADEIAEAVGSSSSLKGRLSTLESGPSIAVGLLALTESASWSLHGLAHSLYCLGVDPTPTILTLLEQGFLAAKTVLPVTDFRNLLARTHAEPVELRAHPAILHAARPRRPEGSLTAIEGPVRLIREADGLEAVLRLATVWQRVAETPLRQTQQRTLYKRDRDRLGDDLALASPIADAIEPIPDMAFFWLELAREVGVVVAEPGTDRLVAASPDYWEENAYHLPQMIASRWLGLRTWHELGGLCSEELTMELGLPYVRAAALLWLSKLPEDAWIAIGEMTAHLDRVAPEWSRPLLDGLPASPADRGEWRATRRKDDPDAGDPLAAILLGPAYQLGLVRTAEHDPSGERLVQLSALGRYILTLGPFPPPRPSFQHFLYVQPNFEIIAYRQGLNPLLVGRLGRFASWSRIGAALELRLTPESVYRGLEGGMPLDAILETLSEHSQRALPAGVAEAIRTWSGRRERVSYFAAATLLEFATAADLEAALVAWPSTSRSAPLRIADRLLLVEDEGSIPWSRLRTAGSRDYRRPGEACVEVEPDGVTLALDLGRSDLLVDAELARFTDELPLDAGRGETRRRFVVTGDSLARAAETGLSASSLSRWFVQRTGAELPASIRLLLHAASGTSRSLATEQVRILRSPTADILDGLLQYPPTRDLIGERLGPTAATVSEHHWPELSQALAKLGLMVQPGPNRPAERPPEIEVSATKRPRSGRR